jgi:hypothetical protein
MQLTGRREPISMSGAWQGRAASYYARGLVLFAVRFCIRPFQPLHSRDPKSWTRFLTNVNDRIQAFAANAMSHSPDGAS